MEERWRWWDVVIVSVVGFSALLVALTFVETQRLYRQTVAVGDAVDISRRSAASQADIARLNQRMSALEQMLRERPAAQPGSFAEPAAREPDGHAEWIERNRDPEAVPGGTLTLNLRSDPGTLNMITENDATVSTIYSQVHESLARRDFQNPSLWVPELATSWDISEDNLVYTFHLREGVRWNDGEPFTADDVVFSYETIMNPGVNCAPLRNYLMDLASVEALDPHTVRFTWARPYFLSFSISAGFSIIPKHIFEFDPEKPHDFNNHPRNNETFGTGPYMLHGWERGDRITLVRNPFYWSRQGEFERIVYRFVSDDETTFLMLERGDLDYIGLTQEQWVRPEKANNDRFRSRFDLHKRVANSYTYIGWNMESPFFGDRRVRQAMTHLVNRELILERVMHGLGFVQTGTFFRESPSYSSDVPPWPFDPARASELLEEAGWRDTDGDGVRDKDGRPFRFEIMYPSGITFYDRVFAIIREDMARAGVVMNLRPTEWAVFLDFIRENKFDASSLAWALSYEQDPYQLWHSSQAVPGGSNHCLFKNDEADQLIESARVEFEEEKRVGLYHRFNAIVHDEQPYTFLFCPQALSARTNKLRNVSFPVAGGSSIRFWWKE